MTMARVEGAPPGRVGPFARLAYWLCRRRFGKVVEPLAVHAHHPAIFQGYGAYEFALGRARKVPACLKTLAGIKAATLVGCPF
jgi:hypothetical protein